MNEKAPGARVAFRGLSVSVLLDVLLDSAREIDPLIHRRRR